MSEPFETSAKATGSEAISATMTTLVPSAIAWRSKLAAKRSAAAALPAIATASRLGFMNISDASNSASSSRARREVSSPGCSDPPFTDESVSPDAAGRQHRGGGRRRWPLGAESRRKPGPPTNPAGQMLRAPSRSGARVSCATGGLAISRQSEPCLCQGACWWRCLRAVRRPRDTRGSRVVALVSGSGVTSPKCRCSGICRPRWISESPLIVLPDPVSFSGRGRRGVVGRRRR